MKTFTDVTWDNSVFGSGITRRSINRGWTALHDLAVEAFRARGEDTGLPFDAFRELVTAAESGLPIIIRHRTGAGKTERTYIVEQFISYTQGTTSNLYVRSWGFAHPLALSEIVEVRVPEQIFLEEEERRDAPEPGEYGYEEPALHRDEISGTEEK